MSSSFSNLLGSISFDSYDLNQNENCSVSRLEGSKPDCHSKYEEKILKKTKKNKFKANHKRSISDEEKETLEKRRRIFIQPFDLDYNSENEEKFRTPVKIKKNKDYIQTFLHKKRCENKRKSSVRIFELEEVINIFQTPKKN